MIDVNRRGAFPTPSADGLTLFFNRSTAVDSDDSDIWISTRADTASPWSVPATRIGGDHLGTR